MKKLTTTLLALVFLTGATALAWDTPKKDKVALKATQQKVNKATAPKTVKQKDAKVKAK